MSQSLLTLMVGGGVDCAHQGLVKGEKFCFRNLYFYFWHGESTSTASQLTSPASQKSKDLNKVPLLLQGLEQAPLLISTYENAACNKNSKATELKQIYVYIICRDGNTRALIDNSDLYCFTTGWTKIDPNHNLLINKCQNVCSYESSFKRKKFPYTTFA